MITPALKRLTAIFLFVNVFAAEAIFRHRAYEDKSIDLQVMMKLGVWVTTFVYALWLYRLWAGKLMRLDNVLQLLLLGMITISCFYAPNFAYSLASAFTLIAVMFMLQLSASVLDNREIIRQLFMGCSLVGAMSLFTYFFNPAFGRMPEYVGGQYHPGRRLSGITGTANASGYIAAMCLICLYYYRPYFNGKIPLYYWLFIAINFSVLMLSNSRTSLAAMILSVCAAAMMRASPARFAAMFTALCLAIIFFSFVDYDALFSMIARSGDASEITSGTGRTAIWKVTLDMIMQRPFFGWGYASSNTLIPGAAAEVGFEASHTHNAYLQVAHSIGFVGLFVFVMLLLIKAYFSVRSGNQINLALIVFLMLDGITEPVAFQGVATTTTLVLATVLSLNYEKPAP